MFQTEMMKLSKRELFERCKELDTAIEDLREYEPVDSDDEDQNTGAYFSCIREFNEHYQLLFKRIFRKHKIFKTVNF